MATKRRSDMTPEEVEKKRERKRAYYSSPKGKEAKRQEGIRRRERDRKLPADERTKSKTAEYLREYRKRRIAENAEEFYEKQRSINKTAYWHKPEYYRLMCRARRLRKKLRGSDQSTSKKIFAEIMKACAQDFNKDDIISEAFIMVMEGKPIDEAVNLARKKANKFGNEMRFNTTDIDDAFWLGEPADFGDSDDLS